MRKYLATYHIGHLVEEQREVWVHASILCTQLACGVLSLDWLLSMQLAAIDKDFLKFRSDMEAKVSHKNAPIIMTQ